MIELPEEIIEYIISFTCDKRGYNIEKYNKRKKENEKRMIRIIFELKFWTNMRTSISWLKGTKDQKKNYKIWKQNLKKGKLTVSYHTGCYRNDYHEKAEVSLMRRQKRMFKNLFGRDNMEIY